MKRAKWLLLAVLALGLAGCGYSGTKGQNSELDRPKPAQPGN
jgi:uncharacterized lipoprotein